MPHFIENHGFAAFVLIGFLGGVSRGGFEGVTCALVLVGLTAVYVRGE